MENIQTLSLIYNRELISSFTGHTSRKKNELMMLLFRYALPFVLLDSVFVAALVLFHYVNMGVVPFIEMLFFLYSVMFLVLIVMQKGFEGWYAEFSILVYIMFIALLGIVMIYAFDRFGAVFSIYVTNFILLPIMNIGFVIWQWKRRHIKFSKFFRVFCLGTAKLHLQGLFIHLACSLVLLSTFVYAALIEPNNIQIEETEFPKQPNLSK